MAERRKRPAIERFEEKIERDENGCWNWTAYKTAGGYGRFWDGDHLTSSHRWSYEHFVGPIPEDREIDHLCRNTSCCNPDHLEAVTHQENLQRAPDVRFKVNARKTHCPRGHEYTAGNIYMYGKSRVCRRCTIDRQIARKRAKREQANGNAFDEHDGGRTAEDPRHGVRAQADT